MRFAFMQMLEPAACIGTEQTAVEEALNYTKGRFVLLCNDNNNWTEAIRVKEYPSNGMSPTIQNTNTNGNAIVSVNGDEGFEVWLFSAKQGIVYYTCGTVPSYNPQPINPPSPSISASPTEISMEAIVNQSSTETIEIIGENLTDKINLTINGENASMFSLSASSLESTGSVTITYSPTEEAYHSATLTISSAGAASIDIPLKGAGLPSVSGIDDLTTKSQLPSFWYNLHGVKINSDNLTPGIYIRRQGTSFKKIIIK